MVFHGSNLADIRNKEGDCNSNVVIPGRCLPGEVIEEEYGTSVASSLNFGRYSSAQDNREFNRIISAY